MNWKKIYDDLIESRKCLNRKKHKRTHVNYVYYERHHIIPKSCGGGNEPENLILLTPKEHFCAHLLLASFSKGDAKNSMVFALWAMCHSKKHKGYKISSRKYDEIKKMMIDCLPINLSEVTKRKISESHIGRIKSVKHLENILKTRRDNGKPWHEKDTKSKISTTLKQKYKTGEINLTKSTFKKGSKPWNATGSGNFFSKKSREKMRDSHLGQKLTIEQIKKREETRRKNGWNKKDRKIKNDV
jgi:hypothetical protein